MQKKIDICVVTKNSNRNFGYLRKYIPLCKFIIETSKPLGYARMQAIQKVESEWFVFIDDDILLSQDWFNVICKEIKDDVGAIHGLPLIYGLGKSNEAINKIMRKQKIGELKAKQFYRQRMKTHNTLIRTKLVKDWRPTPQDLVSWEDYEIGKHIMDKGFKVIIANTFVYNIRTWRRVFCNAIWNAKGFKQVFSKRQVVIYFIRNFVNALRTMVDFRLPIGFRCYQILMNFGMMGGLIFAS